jgi:hypothetical protein
MSSLDQPAVERILHNPVHIGATESNEAVLSLKTKPVRIIDFSGAFLAVPLIDGAAQIGYSHGLAKWKKRRVVGKSYGILRTQPAKCGVSGTGK